MLETTEAPPAAARADTGDPEPVTPRAGRGSVKALAVHVNGARWRGPMAQEELEFVTGERVMFGIVPEAMLEELYCASTQLSELELHEIVAFLYNVGQNWKRRDYVRRSVYERHLVQYLGYSPRAAQNEADWIALLLSSSFRFFDLLASELGAWQVMDAWTPREEAHVRALPRGTVLHLAPSNVPLSVVVSVLRALITKNRSIVKVSAADPFTATALVQSFADIDPRHPVTTSVSVVFWPTRLADEVGAAVARRADVLVAWGGAEAIAWAMKFASLRTEVVAFGPKRSLAFIGAGADPRTAADAVATDVSLYDQRACFSTRQVFVHTSVQEAFLEALAKSLAKLEAILPAGVSSIDGMAIRALGRAHAAFLGDAYAASGSNSWAIIRGAGAEQARASHPMGRTVYVSGFDQADELYAAIDPDVQTVAVHPWAFAEEVRDECALRGAGRFVECGMSNVFRVGGSHDATFPLQRLVRVVATELPRRSRVKGIHVPIDQMEFLENDRFLEFAP